MLNSIVLSALIVILVINFVMDINSRKSDRIYDSKIQQRINILSKKVNSTLPKKDLKILDNRFTELKDSLEQSNSELSRSIGFRIETMSRDLEITMSTLDSVQEKIAELEVSIQNLSNKK